MSILSRDIIQISTAPQGYGVVVHALCDDGTVWRNDGSSYWQQLGPIPDREGITRTLPESDVPEDLVV